MSAMPPVKLRRSQRELLELIVAGRRQIEIARMWKVAPNAINDSMLRIRRKLGARSNFDLIVIALRDGHVAMPPARRR